MDKNKLGGCVQRSTRSTLEEAYWLLTAHSVEYAEELKLEYLRG